MTDDRQRSQLPSSAMTTTSAATAPDTLCQPWCATPDDRPDGSCSTTINPLTPTTSSWWITHIAGWNTHTGRDEYALVIDRDDITGPDATINIPITAGQAAAIATTLPPEGTHL